MQNDVFIIQRVYYLLDFFIFCMPFMLSAPVGRSGPLVLFLFAVIELLLTHKA